MNVCLSRIFQIVFDLERVVIMDCYICEEVNKIERNKKEESEFHNNFSKLLSGDRLVASRPIIIGVTPNAIDCCLEHKGLDLVITKSVIKKCMKKEIRDESGKQIKKSGHGLTEQMINDVVWAIKRPVMILRGSKPQSIALMTELKDKEERYIFVFISVNQINAVGKVNVVASVYGRNNYEEYLRRSAENNMILAINKEKVDDLHLSIGGHFSEAIAPINFDSTIAYTYNSVKIDIPNLFILV